MNMTEKIRGILEKESVAIRNIPVTDKFGEAVEIIYKYVHGKNGKLVTSGMGKAGQIAHNIAFLHPSEAQHGDLGILQKNDVLLTISNSGKTREIIELIDLKNNLYPQIPLIVITSDENSPLAQKADCYILTGNPGEVCPLGLTPTTSTTVMTVIGDVLVVLLMEKIGFNAVDYSKRHHGGYLGRKSREISERDKL
jgi:arabinose-5-phosphate isomerase